MFIQGELRVDDFLTDDDRRAMGEDLTDRFDYTFLLGDLNFRLDISRTHADWLISRRDYAQALGFDQLRNIMQHGDAFEGFNEADINFPPTFKYDVMRTLNWLGPGPTRSARRYSVLADVEAEARNGDGHDDNDVDSPFSLGNALSSYRLWPERELAEGKPSESALDDEVGEGHVEYDSSSKQSVPSW